ncbi:MAG: aspartate--ammonia ligase [Calditrichia bacterium]|nr:aspartate--ammonia ligase [Calditrichia bacterium]
MTYKCITAEDYQPVLDFYETESAIRTIKEFFQINLSKELNLRRVTAPLFVKSGTGINDDLNGIEKPVTFNIKGDNNAQVEIVQSLAKWKRMALADYHFNHGEGLYTDMNALRPDEILDNLHSVYVDQWDWERIVSKEERNEDFLKSIVKKIYRVLKKTELHLHDQYPEIEPILPDEITFIHTEELEEKYPDLSPKEREFEICKKHNAVFILGIGSKLKNGEPHDGRAPDYDDWTTQNGNGMKGLNGDIVVWNPVLNIAFELSSMGIRVDKEALERQLEIANAIERKSLYFHSRLLNDELPLSIGGGIGQSRLCMFFLKKAHVGEVQASIWPEEMKKQCKQNNVFLL